MNNQRHIFTGGHLLEEIEQTRENALRIGALLPIPTDFEYIEDGEVRFLIRILSRLTQKDKEKREKQLALSKENRPANPFLPYDEDLYVADISMRHVALLNKFNVLNNHLLIITRDFEDQRSLLTIDDFEALCICLAEFDGLGFYNGGVAAGASQAHKHLQIVPLPLDPKGPETPIEPLLLRDIKQDGVTRIAAFPFLNAVRAIDPVVLRSPRDAAAVCFDAYSQLLAATGLTPPSHGNPTMQSGPYCLLVTRRWMLLVPRSREHFESISINSLGFAGSFFLRSRKEYELLRKAGPVKALQNVSLPLTSGR